MYEANILGHCKLLRIFASSPRLPSRPRRPRGPGGPACVAASVYGEEEEVVVEVVVKVVVYSMKMLTLIQTYRLDADSDAYI